MEMSASRMLPVDRDTAWRALNDPEALKAAIPGCESMEKTGDNEYTAVVAASIGPVKARFKGKLAMEDVVPPESYTIRFEGQGGPAGFSKGTAQVKLTAEGGQTKLEYTASAQVGGRIAQAGQRLIDAAAAKLADEFFATFSAQLAPAAPAGAETPAAPVAEEKAGLSPVWIILAGLALLLLLPYLLR